MFWLHFATGGGYRDAAAIFIYVNDSDLEFKIRRWKRPERAFRWFHLPMRFLSGFIKVLFSVFFKGGNALQKVEYLHRLLVYMNHFGGLYINIL